MQPQRTPQPPLPAIRAKALHLALVGAFPFPLPQGSQAFFEAQARALMAAGARVTLFTYGRGAGPGPPDLEVVRTDPRLSPRRLASGPSFRKPFADAALVAKLIGHQRRDRFHAVLAHNAEAALAALAARVVTRFPVVYVAHTLLGPELPAYGPYALARPLERLGRYLDRMLARRADAVQVLSRAAERVLRTTARGRVACIPPGLEPSPPPTARATAAICREHGLTPGRFVLYAGNLDRYQDLDDLAAAAERLDVLVAVATHSPYEAPQPLLTVHVGNPDEARALCFAAAVTVLPRRRPGGFPIKLLQYMEAARPIVARAGVVDGLADGRSVWLLDREATPDDLADGIRALLDQPELARALGRGGREVLEAEHRWPGLTERTLELVEAARALRSGGRQQLVRQQLDRKT